MKQKEGTPWNPAVMAIYPVEVDTRRDFVAKPDETGVFASQ
jgi:hypothetical protein